MAAGANRELIRKLKEDLKEGVFSGGYHVQQVLPVSGNPMPSRLGKQVDPRKNKTSNEISDPDEERKKPSRQRRNDERDAYEVQRVITHPSMTSSMASLDLKIRNFHDGILPTLFISHGNGCMPLLWEKGHPSLHCFEELGISNGLGPENVKCIVIISAQWEPDDDLIGITNVTHNKLYYDFHQAPNECYHLPYKPPGHPGVAARCFDLLRVSTGEEARVPRYVSGRGLDHGVFVPLMMIRGFFNIPVVQIGLPWEGLWWDRADLAIRVGRRLAPLRKEGCLIVGSGQSVNPHKTSRCGPEVMAFNNALKYVVTQQSGSKRLSHLRNWPDLPGSNWAHGREEHLLPLLVCAGAAQKDSAEIAGDVLDGVTPMTHFLFGGVRSPDTRASSYKHRSATNNDESQRLSALTSLSSTSLRSRSTADVRSNEVSSSSISRVSSASEMVHAGTRKNRWTAHRKTLDHDYLYDPFHGTGYDEPRI
jgi:aromatic ring-opening dioxygenase catalytic subunit (LigB family)